MNSSIRLAKNGFYIGCGIITVILSPLYLVIGALVIIPMKVACANTYRAGRYYAFKYQGDQTPVTPTGDPGSKGPTSPKKGPRCFSLGEKLLLAAISLWILSLVFKNNDKPIWALWTAVIVFALGLLYLIAAFAESRAESKLRKAKKK